ncbi:hypothetical protein, partial [Bradyrhizobium lablabi]|uniref:hypothetical protein n=1 Tax=Bradyrhizobium lablabi TaxID=722472 RepID=UPI001BACD86F
QSLLGGRECGNAWQGATGTDAMLSSCMIRIRRLWGTVEFPVCRKAYLRGFLDAILLWRSSNLLPITDRKTAEKTKISRPPAELCVPTVGMPQASTTLRLPQNRFE